MSDPTPAEPARPETEAALAPLRQRIDELDRDLVRLLNERARVVVDIGKVKRDADAAIYAPDREHRVLGQIRSFNEGPLPDTTLEAIWRELMSGSFALERPLRIGYLGPPGSFSHLAAVRKFGHSVEYDDLADIRSIFDEVAREHVDLGLVPIENSAIGGIGETLDSFLDASATICAEVQINIHHQLLSNTPVERIVRVYSKPEAMAQCRGWLGGQLPAAERVPAPSTSRAAELAAGEEGSAAIGSTLAGELYGLKRLFENIEDNPNNTTRFFVIGRHPTKPTGDDKTSVMFTTEHKAGALSAVLDVFREHDLNLTHLSSRPSQRVNWEYVFFIDLLAHGTEPRLQRAVEAAKEHCLHMTLLGSYPRAREVL